MLLLKFAAGTREWVWTRMWGYSGNETAAALALDAAGNIYVAGTSDSFDLSGATDMVVLKYDLDGTILDAWTWGTAGVEDTAHAITAFKTDGGGCIVAGHTEGTGQRDGLVARFSPAGVQQWARHYNALSAGTFHASALAGDGTIVVGGGLDTGGATPRALLLRYDLAGTALAEYAWSAGPSAVHAIKIAGSSITLGGSAPGSYGGWEPANGFSGVLADHTVHPAGYVTASPPGSLLFPDGADSTPAGYGEDDGEGGNDALVVWYSPGT